MDSREQERTYRWSDHSLGDPLVPPVEEKPSYLPLAAIVVALVVLFVVVVYFGVRIIFP